MCCDRERINSTLQRYGLQDLRMHALVRAVLLELQQFRVTGDPGYIVDRKTLRDAALLALEEVDDECGVCHG